MMNFYSDDIINDIIDNEDLENIIDKIDKFYSDAVDILSYYSFRTISPHYTEHILYKKDVKIAFLCMDHVFKMPNCPSAMIYYKYKDKSIKEIHYYILFVCTKPTFKNLGYASMLMNQFIERVRTENLENTEYSIKIIISSLDTAVSYYKSYGFKHVEGGYEKYPRLLKFEKLDKNNPSFVMDMDV
jgi:GNAT superfamily N-acetyltransferase